MSISIKPLHDRVTIQPIQQNEKQGSIIVPTNDKKLMEGKVISVGPGRINDKGEIMKLSVSSGDIVLYQKWSATETGIEDIVIIKESDILAKTNN